MTATKSLTVTWLILCIIFQQNTSQAAEEIAQLKGEIATTRAEFEKKIKDLEAALSTSTKENAQLKKTPEDQESSWKTRLTSAEQKLGESQESLQNITSKIGEMVKAIWGTFTRNLLHIPVSCIIIMVCS